MDTRAQRIVDTAIGLAEKGGFEAVRLRDVAAEADVALGTLYRHFRSKEDLLIAALTREVERLESTMRSRPTSGGTALARVTGFVGAVTEDLMRRPRLARAILRAATSGDQELSKKVAGFHDRITGALMEAMRSSGTPAGVLTQADEKTIAMLLQHVWFSCLIAWGGGSMSPREVIDQMNNAAAMLMRDAAHS